MCQCWRRPNIGSIRNEWERSWRERNKKAEWVAPELFTGRDGEQEISGPLADRSLLWLMVRYPCQNMKCNWKQQLWLSCLGDSIKTVLCVISTGTSMSVLSFYTDLSIVCVYVMVKKLKIQTIKLLISSWRYTIKIILDLNIIGLDLNN